MEPFYSNRQRREAEPLERRLLQMEYHLERLAGGVSETIQQQIDNVLRVPNEVIAEGVPESLVLAAESDGVLLSADDAYVLVDTSAGPEARTMPRAGSASNPISIKNIGPNALSIYSDDLIDGEPVLTLWRQWSAVTLVSNGTTWSIFSVYLPAERLQPTLALVLLELRKMALHLASMSGEEVTDADAEGE